MFKPIHIIGIAVFFILSLFSLGFCEESFTITTYYPSPYGSYNELYVADKLGIGTTSPFVKLHAISSARTGPLVLESYNTYDVFSVLPWAGGTYLSSGIYYKDGAWVHDSYDTNNALFGISGGTGGRWYDSNNSSGSWNVASNVQLWTPAGVLVGASSRKLKENFTPLNIDDILQKIDQLDISRWNYKSEGSAITHIGPVSEDFRELFKIGDSSETIALIDEGGVALVGIKALSNKLSVLESGVTVDKNTGNVGIGTTGPTHLIHLNGGAYCDGTGDWIAGSDRAYKKDIDYNFKYGLKTVEQLRPVYYVHKQDKTNKRQIGFIAQDVKEAIPELVSGEEGSYGLSYGQLTTVLVNAIKEQQREIEILKAEIDSLKKKL